MTDELPPLQQALQPWLPLIIQKAQQYGVPPAVLAGIIAYESGGNPQAINKSSGATGLGQVMPREAGFAGRPTRQELLDPQTNIDWSARILSDGVKRYGVPGGVASYLGAVDPRTGQPTDAADANGTTGHTYVRNVLGLAQRLGDWVAQRTVSGTAEAAGETSMSSDNPEVMGPPGPPPGWGGAPGAGGPPQASELLPTQRAQAAAKRRDEAKKNRDAAEAKLTRLEANPPSDDPIATKGWETAVKAAQSAYDRYDAVYGREDDIVAKEQDAGAKAQRTPNRVVTRSGQIITVDPETGQEVGEPLGEARPTSAMEKEAAGLYGAQADEARARTGQIQAGTARTTALTPYEVAKIQAEADQAQYKAARDVFIKSLDDKVRADPSYADQAAGDLIKYDEFHQSVAERQQAEQNKRLLEQVVVQRQQAEETARHNQATEASTERERGVQESAEGRSIAQLAAELGSNAHLAAVLRRGGPPALPGTTPPVTVDVPGPEGESIGMRLLRQLGFTITPQGVGRMGPSAPYTPPPPAAAPTGQLPQAPTAAAPTPPMNAPLPVPDAYLAALGQAPQENPDDPRLMNPYRLPAAYATV